MVRKSLWIVLFSGIAMAQTASDGLSDQVLHFAQTQSQQSRQEIVNAMRSIGELRDVTVDLAADLVTVRGTAPQLGLAQWMFNELDQVAAPARGPQQYQIPGDSVPDVRVFFLTHATTPQAVQEMINTLRSIGEIQRAVAYTANSAMVLRGSYDQMQLAAWLIPLLDLPPGVQTVAAPLEYHYNDPFLRYPATAVRVFRLAHATNPLAMQEIVNAVRSIAGVQRITANSGIASLTMRSAPAQAALAAWMIQQLDQQATARSAPAMVEYPDGLAGLQPPPAPPASDQTVKIASLAHTRTPQAMQELVNQIRSTARTPWVVYSSLARAVTLRGTASQMAAAEKVIQEADK